PVRETEKHDAAKILVQDGVDDIGDVGRQADLGTGEVSTLTDTCQAWRENLMARCPERAADLAEAVRAAPRAVNQNKDRHRRGLPGRVGRRAHQYVEGEHGQEQRGQHDGGRAGPAAHEAPPVARPVSSSAATMMPSRRKADATRARSSRPTSNWMPGSVRATIRTENVSTSIFSTPM